MYPPSKCLIFVYELFEIMNTFSVFLKCNKTERIFSCLFVSYLTFLFTEHYHLLRMVMLSVFGLFFFCQNTNTNTNNRKDSV
ncbi:hypothetical protein EUTSA_v10011904mg [Eutrema salsugineum]|uniref:Uncharacterized protein n=1 Tax=Eutrema salsugineum TaxID=72664 RepID=V4KRW6_EUTSA|nr:hypothetical protein EUTSA_v10011904mg [Eutrema salsugineum]